MKKIIITLALVTSTLLSYGQGTIGFSNGATSKAQLDGAAIPLGTALNFGVFVGSSAVSLSLVPTLGGLSTTTTGIIWVNGAASTAYTIPGFDVNSTPFMQFRGWSASFGSDWAAAKASGVNGTMYGETPILQVAGLGAASGAPGTAVWQSASGVNPNRFHPLQLTTVVPEPSTIALGVIGAGSLLFLRRKK